MKIRQLNSKERGDAFYISAVSFHARVEDPAAEREKAEADTKEDWGAFGEDGTLMARIINNKYDFYLDGTPVRAGGIGAVSTLPEYRDSGAIREIFRELLPAAYRDGEVISALYPFKHAFYRKQGYETVTLSGEYRLKPQDLWAYRFDGEARQWQPGDSPEPYLAVYEAFAPRFNMAAVRTAEGMGQHIGTDKLLTERKFSYLLSHGGVPSAYLTFTDIRHDPEPILQVRECAWATPEGFRDILGFLGRFEADYGEIRLPLPAGIELYRILKTSQAYGVKKETQQHFMVRAVNVQRVLEIIRKPADAELTLRIRDALIPENDGVFRVKDGQVVKLSPANGTDGSADADGGDGADSSDGAECADGAYIDADLSIQAFSQLAVGAINVDEVMLREDVQVFGEAAEERLRRCFTEKPIFVSEHF